MRSHEPNSKLTALEREVLQLRRALASQQHYLDSVHETTLGLIQRFSVDDLLASILSKAGLLAGTADVFLYLYDSHADELVMKLGQGVYTELLGIRLKSDRGLAGKVYTTGESILIEDYAIWSGRASHKLYDKLHSALAIPLKSGAKIIGVVGLGSFDINKPFDQNNVRNMSRFAKLASVALENARLNADLQKELNRRRLAEKSVRTLNAKLEKRVAERTKKLEQATSEIKTLKSIVPICSQCKKIRDDKGYWNLLESYIEKHSDASFSHSLCPACTEKLYGEEDWYKEM